MLTGAAAAGSVWSTGDGATSVETAAAAAVAGAAAAVAAAAAAVVEAIPR